MSWLTKTDQFLDIDAGTCKQTQLATGTSLHAIKFPVIRATDGVNRPAGIALERAIRDMEIT